MTSASRLIRDAMQHTERLNFTYSLPAGASSRFEYGRCSKTREDLDVRVAQDLEVLASKGVLTKPAAVRAGNLRYICTAGQTLRGHFYRSGVLYDNCDGVRMCSHEASAAFLACPAIGDGTVFDHPSF